MIVVCFFGYILLYYAKPLSGVKQHASRRQKQNMSHEDGKMRSVTCDLGYLVLYNNVELADGRK